MHVALNIDKVCWMGEGEIFGGGNLSWPVWHAHCNYRKQAIEVFPAMLRHTTQCYQAYKMLFPKIKFNIKSYAKTVKSVYKMAIFLYSEFNGNRRP